MNERQQIVDAYIEALVAFSRDFFDRTWAFWNQQERDAERAERWTYEEEFLRAFFRRVFEKRSDDKGVNPRVSLMMFLTDHIIAVVYALRPNNAA